MFSVIDKRFSSTVRRGVLKIAHGWLRAQTGRSLEQSNFEITKDQDMKDSTRDSYFINGSNSKSLLKGSELGYNGIVEMLSLEIERLCPEMTNNEGDDVRVSTAAACLIIHASSRTLTGGDSYEAMF